MGIHHVRAVFFDNDGLSSPGLGSTNQSMIGSAPINTIGDCADPGCGLGHGFGLGHTAGFSVTFTANPIAAYRFGAWEGDIESTVNPVALNIHHDMTVTARFSTNIYFLPIILHSDFK